MLAELKAHAQDLRLALMDGDKDAAAKLQTWLMGEVAAGLIEQESDALLDLRAAIADLPQVADRYGDGKPGDRWRAVWELLYTVGQTSRPMEQQRLMRPETVPGQLLRLIADTPGIAPTKMAEDLSKETNHISNTLRALLDQGLVYRVPRGRTASYYVTPEAAEGLPNQVPENLVRLPEGVTAANDQRFHFIDPPRLLRSGDVRQLPGRSLLAAGSR
jgi:hypothetical protein